MTRPAFKNAIAVVMALGGSTNAVEVFLLAWSLETDLTMALPELHVAAESQDSSSGAALHAHARPITQIAHALDTHLTEGLSSRAAQARLTQYGPNALPEASATPLWRQVVAQLANPLVLLLIAAALISILLSEGVDAAAILAIVVLNATLGVVQEARAARALQALRNLAVPQIQALRDGRWATLPAMALVPGDIVQL